LLLNFSHPDMARGPDSLISMAHTPPSRVGLSDRFPFSGLLCEHKGIMIFPINRAFKIKNETYKKKTVE